LEFEGFAFGARDDGGVGAANVSFMLAPDVYPNLGESYLSARRAAEKTAVRSMLDVLLTKSLRGTSAERGLREALRF